MMHKAEEIKRAEDVTDIKAGSRVLTKEGVVILVQEVSVHGLHLGRADVHVKYSYQTSAGKCGVESVSIDNFMNNVMGK